MRRFIAGAHCWIPDAERAFAEGVVESIDGKKAKVKKNDGKVLEVAEATLLPRAPDRVVAEMDTLMELNEASVLQNVELLFGQVVAKRPGDGFSTIYSGVGPVLIAMNPFKELAIYGKDWVKAYHDAAGDEARNNQLGPHCYRTVQEAYSRLYNQKYQSIVICGESGAGKTVTNRKMIEYLLEVAKPAGGGTVDVQAISEANVLLESFGNAKTTRNHNSSRFGKYTKLQFTGQATLHVSGCGVEHYLLERSRVVHHTPAERNYHIFYELLTSDKCKEYDLEPNQIDKYNYIKNSAKVKEINDVQDWKDLWAGMEKAGFPDNLRENIMKCCAAVLHLGNISFKGK